LKARDAMKNEGYLKARAPENDEYMNIEGMNSELRNC